MPSVDPSRTKADAERPFGIGDAMILVASAASSFAVARTLDSGPFTLIWETSFASFRDNLARIEYRLVEALMPLTLACLIIRCRKPRATFRRIARQPGFVASVSATIPLAVIVGSTVVVAIRAVNSAQVDVAGLELRASHACGYAVAAGWAGLAIGRRRRSDRGWVDRLGRAVGVAWVLVVVLQIVRFVIQ